MEGYISWCPTGIHTRSFIIQYTFMWPILFLGRLRHCKLCGWYYNLYDKRKKESVISALETSSSLLFGWFNNNFMKANSESKKSSHNELYRSNYCNNWWFAHWFQQNRSSHRNHNWSWITTDQSAFRFQCKTLFTVMILIDAIMAK